MPQPPTQVITAAQDLYRKFHPKGELPSVMCAQGVLESDWFTKPSGKFNFYGIKATKQQIIDGQATCRMTHEYINGQYITEPQYFADYPSLEAGLEAHAELLMKSWYKDVQVARTYDAQARALLRDHYATAPNYAEALIAIIRDNNFTQYDAPVVLPTSPTPIQPVPPPITSIHIPSFWEQIVKWWESLFK
jgi:flagellum-specific peptidoglycan hydrolase FlgJ